MIDINRIQDWLINSGKIAIEYFGKSQVGHDFKSDNTIVTEADFAIEKYLRSKIKETYPEHTIIGEEYDNDPGNEYAWILDPIDGSAPYFWNIPTWCTSIGITKNLQPYMGFVYVPLTGDLYSSIDNRSILNGKMIHASDETAITSKSAFCMSTRAFNKYSLVNFEGMVFALGSGIMHNMLVARGKLVGALSISPSVWDLAAAVKILQGSGAEICYLNGKPFELAELHNSRRVSNPVLAAPRHLMNELLSIIKVSD